MNQFPNAKKGVSLLFVSEILGLIGVLLTGIFTVLGLTSLVMLALAGTLGIVGVIIMMVSAVMELVGLAKGSKDNRYFSYSIWFIVIALVLSIISAFPIGDVFKTVCTALGSVVDLAVMLFVISGVREMLPDTPLAQKGKNISVVVLVAVILSVIAQFLVVFTTTSVVLSLCSLILKIIYYIMYITFLAQAKKEL